MKLLKNGTALALSLLICQQAAAIDNLKFSGTLIIPPPCTVGSDSKGSLIDVVFPGRMPVDKIDGNNFMLPVAYKINCDGAGTPGLDLKLSIIGMDAKFAGSEGVLQAKGQTDLGVQILYGDNTTKKGFKLNEPMGIFYSAPPTLWAVPVKRPGGTLKDGSFEATATLKAEYQ
ncbi:fimbrial protein [Erwinia sp. SLM-02]|uniref:fimbrial protein n=1 Tax=Erwinia sp. SLM-02 TaxID=3020057 RepID=UPI0028D307D9|nr:fimbrial protein [uncultured Erwinia sp.]